MEKIKTPEEFRYEYANLHGCENWELLMNLVTENGKRHHQDSIMQKYAEYYHKQKTNENKTFSMIRDIRNTYEDIACVNKEVAERYVNGYNTLSGEDNLFIDEDVYILYDDNLTQKQNNN